MPRSLKYGLEMLAAHCAATGKNQIDLDFAVKFLKSTPYASEADKLSPDHLHRATIDDQQ